MSFIQPAIIASSIFLFAVILDFFIILKWREHRTLKLQRGKAGESIHKPGDYKQTFFAGLRSWWNQSIQRTQSNVTLRANLLIVLELGLLAFWTIIVCRDYLDMNPRIVPLGREFGSAIQTNHLWTQVQKCGWCAVWNGFELGGYPAFADIQGSMLHPITMVTTLLWGVVNGVKVTLVLSFWVAGLAQWWIARELNLGWLPRLWSAGIAIAGGHLSGRMELGVPGVILSIAMTSLVFAALIRLARTGERKDAVLVGIITASAILSGQGYIQVGLIGIIPAALLFLVYKRNSNMFAVLKNYILAAGIAFLLSAPLLLPLAHFGPNIAKEMDFEFLSVQPISYFVLNLVINDAGYFYSELMGKFPYPYLYTLYIGWVPILLAVYVLNKVEGEHRKFLWFMASGVIIEFLIASGILLRGLVKVWPALAGVRHPPQIGSLAIPLILGLSAYGLNKLLAIHWPFLSFNYKEQKWSLPLQWIVTVPLMFSLLSCLHFSQIWIDSVYITDDVYKILERLKTKDMQWVEPPFGDHYFIEPAIAMGLKLSPGIMTWSWKNRQSPDAVLYATREGVPPGEVREIGSFQEITYYARDNAPYAGIVTENGIQSCEAHGSGGFIQVSCNVPKEGKLVLQENMWSGWQAWLDQEKTEIIEGSRLQVTAPAGKHTFTFRYLPWDVPLGLLLFTIGVFSSIFFWRSPEKI